VTLANFVIVGLIFVAGMDVYYIANHLVNGILLADGGGTAYSGFPDLNLDSVASNTVPFTLLMALHRTFAPG
jgi:hypothetical protein